MGTTLQNGIYLPAEGERNCYSGLAANWTAIDGVIGGYSSHAANLTIHVTAEDKAKWDAVTSKADASALTAHTGDTTIHVTAEDKATWNGKADASALTAHTGDTTIHVTAEDKETWNGKADASALTAHTGDTTIHVTAEDKQAWNGKQDALSQTQLDAVNSGIDSSKVQQIATNTSDISSLQSGKANDSDVVHKSGNETVGGSKIFSDNLTIYNSDDTQTPKGLTIRNAQWGMGESGGLTTSSINFLDKNSAIPASIIASKGLYGQSFLRFSVRTKDSQNNILGEEIYYDIDKSGNVEFRSWHDNIISLGTFAYKWKDVNTYLVNGINPGALFLPQDRTARVDISAYFTNTANGATNRVTSPEDGYIYLAVTDVVTIHCFSQNASNLTHYGQTFALPSAGQLNCLFPVRKNDNVAVQWYTTAAAVTVSNAFFIPCKGNI